MGFYFYWLCDCSAIKEVLEYSGSIPIIYRLAQELLGYQFSVVHYNKKMMTDVGNILGCFDTLITTHYCVANVLHQQDLDCHPLAYSASIFNTCATVISNNTVTPTIVDPILLYIFITISYSDGINVSLLGIDLPDDKLIPDASNDHYKVPTILLSFSPVLFLDLSLCTAVTSTHEGSEMTIVAVSKNSSPSGYAPTPFLFFVCLVLAAYYS